MRVVIDTNELLRMASAWNSPVSPLLNAWRNGRFELALSDAMLDEFEAVADRSHTRRFLSPQNARAFVAFARDWAMFVSLSTDIPVPRCRDSKDDVVIATAIAARADVIVTNDSDLLDEAALVVHLRDEWNIRVMQAGEFMTMLGAV